jgi:hypothetical protein
MVLRLKTRESRSLPGLPRGEYDYVGSSSEIVEIISSLQCPSIRTPFRPAEWGSCVLADARVLMHRFHLRGIDNSGREGTGNAAGLGWIHVAASALAASTVFSSKSMSSGRESR